MNKSNKRNELKKALLANVKRRKESTKKQRVISEDKQDNLQISISDKKGLE